MEVSQPFHNCLEDIDCYLHFNIQWMLEHLLHLQTLWKFNSSKQLIFIVWFRDRTFMSLLPIWLRLYIYFTWLKKVTVHSLVQRAMFQPLLKILVYGNIKMWPNIPRNIYMFNSYWLRSEKCRVQSPSHRPIPLLVNRFGHCLGNLGSTLCYLAKYILHKRRF